jgi:membrane protease YdiL (CAAX protease family)
LTHAAEPARRRPVVVVTLAVGCTLLGLSLATAPGDGLFYPLLLAVAAVWIGGALASGPVPFRPRAGDGPVRWARPVALGLLAAGVFLVGGLVVHEIEPLREFAANALDHERRGNTVLVALLTLANAVGEEVFFRGALFAAVGPRRRLLITTAVYVAATTATGNPLLVFAAVLMGSLFGWQRELSGGVVDPMLTHLTWSLVMLTALPSIIG